MKLDSRGYLDSRVRRQDVEAVVSRLSYSDWLILYFLAQSMDKVGIEMLIFWNMHFIDKVNLGTVKLVYCTFCYRSNRKQNYLILLSVMIGYQDLRLLNRNYTPIKHIEIRNG